MDKTGIANGANQMTNQTDKMDSIKSNISRCENNVTFYASLTDANMSPTRLKWHDRALKGWRDNLAKYQNELDKLQQNHI